MGRGQKPIPDGLRKRWPRKENILATRLAHPKWNSYQIGASVGCSSGLVRATLRQHHIRLAPTRFTPHLLDHEKQSIADMYGEGEKLLYIAHEYGITKGSVRRIAKQAGHPPRQIQVRHEPRKASTAAA